MSPSRSTGSSLAEHLSTKLPAPLDRLLKPAISLFLGKTAQKGILAAADQGIISISNFLAALILARAVVPTEFGVYAVGFLLLHLLRALQDGLIVQPLNAFGAVMSNDDFRLYATGNGVFQFILSGGSAAAAAGAGWILTALGNDTAGPTLFTMWFVFLTWPIQEFIRRSFYTRGVITKALSNTLLSNFVRMSILAVWAFQGQLTGRGGLDAIGWGSLAAIGLGIWQARDYWTTRKVSLIPIWKKNWGFGKWVLGGSVANWGAVEVYPILAAGLISFAAAGAYRALQNLVAPVHVLLRAIDTFLTPRAAWLYQREGYQGLGRALRLIYLISGLPILGLLVLVSVFPKPILNLFYGETYLPYSGGTFLMALFYALWYAYWPLQAAFKALRLTRPIFLANLGAILCMFTIGVWAIQQWGIYGAIAGQALNALIVGVGLWATWMIKPRS